MEHKINVLMPRKGLIGDRGSRSESVWVVPAFRVVCACAKLQEVKVYISTRDTRETRATEAREMSETEEDELSLRVMERREEGERASLVRDSVRAKVVLVEELVAIPSRISTD